MGEINLILGPPGTGKTTELLRHVESYFAGGDPEKVGFVSFTRKAVTEASERTKQPEANLPYFRTLHSLCFKLCGMSQNLVMAKEHYFELGEKLGLEISGKYERGQVEEMPAGDRALALDNLARVRRIPLKTVWDELGDELDLDWPLVELVSRGARKYKDLNGMVDFTDMLERFLTSGTAPELDLLLVDEAQDMSPLQWEVVDKLTASSKQVLIAGDDDQAIYRWAGADVSEMIEIASEHAPEVLRQSHRVPKQVHKLAQEISSKILRRLKKEYLPTAEEGFVDRVASVDDAKLSEGDWLLLVRNRYLARPVVDALLRDGLWFDSFLESPSKWPSLKAAVAWEDLRKGREVSLVDALNVVSFIDSKKYDNVSYSLFQTGKKKFVSMADLKKVIKLTAEGSWFEILSGIPSEESEYLRGAARRGENLRQRPRIRVDTIHGAKGGECDNVVVLTDISRRTWTGMNQDPDAEARVFYVAATRAKKTLTIVQPTTPYYFEI